MNRQKLELTKRLERDWKENPIIKNLEDSPIKNITKKEHIQELQEILVQACIDYINKNGLTDIYSIYFNADSLDISAKDKKWNPATDSYIKVEGIRNKRYLRKNGEILKVPYSYKIGDCM